MTNFTNVDLSKRADFNILIVSEAQLGLVREGEGRGGTQYTPCHIWMYGSWSGPGICQAHASSFFNAENVKLMKSRGHNGTRLCVSAPLTLANANLLSQTNVVNILVPAYFVTLDGLMQVGGSEVWGMLSLGLMRMSGSEVGPDAFAGPDAGVGPHLRCVLP